MNRQLNDDWVDKWFTRFFGTAVVVTIVLFAAICFVAYHFVAKYW